MHARRQRIQPRILRALSALPKSFPRVFCPEQLAGGTSKPKKGKRSNKRMRYRVLSSSPLLRSTSLSGERSLSAQRRPWRDGWTGASSRGTQVVGPARPRLFIWPKRLRSWCSHLGFGPNLQQTAFRVHDFLGGHSGAILWGLQLGSSLSVPVIQISPVVSFVIIIAGIVVFSGTKAPRVYSAKHQPPSECSE